MMVVLAGLLTVVVLAAVIERAVNLGCQAMIDVMISRGKLPEAADRKISATDAATLTLVAAVALLIAADALLIYALTNTSGGS